MVRVAPQRLEDAVSASMKVVRHAAEELRAKDLDYLKKR